MHKVGAKVERLLVRSLCEISSTYSAGKVKVVPDHRACAGLTSQRHRLDYHRAQAF
jgi:hypothetical protein